MTATHGGKGSTPRPISDRQKFSDNWDLIFGNKAPAPTQDPGDKIQAHKQNESA